jgi:hypothetical protein
LLNWTLLFRKIAATETLLPVLLSCYCQNRGKKKRKKKTEITKLLPQQTVCKLEKKERGRKKKKKQEILISQKALS